MTKPDRATRAAERIIIGDLCDKERERVADIIRAEYQGAEKLAEYVKLYGDEPPNTNGWRPLRDLARKFLEE